MNLRGARVALLEARLSETLAALVRRHGAEPCCCPAVREERADCSAQVAALVDELGHEASSIFVFSTGVGVEALFGEARRLGREPDLKEAVRRGISVCRGPKPSAALRQVELSPSLAVKAPYTTGDVLAALEAVELRGRHLTLLHYGERNLPLLHALAGRGARVRELVVYEWRLPEDLGPLRELVEELAQGRFAAIAFTSQIQARHLFQVAAEMGRAEALRDALHARTVVAAVGPTCARALEELGAPPHVVPENPKMGSMLQALAGHFPARGGQS